jgi:hypothetical protein
MLTKDMIQSKFLKKEDFATPKALTVGSCTLEEVGQGDQRWVIWFNEESKGLVLNVTKIRQLEAAYGNDSDYWTGKKVRLSHDPNVAFAGKIVGGIRLETQKSQAAAPVVEKDADFDDDIPF